MLLQDILKDSDYQQSQFDLVQIAEFEKRIIIKTDKNGKEIPYIQCLVRKKEVRLTPEEAIRQLYLGILLDDYKYPADRVELEYNVTFGREKNENCFWLKIFKINLSYKLFYQVFIGIIINNIAKNRSK